MNVDGESSSSDLIELHTRLLAHAEELGLSGADAPHLAGCKFDGSFGSEVANISKVDLPPKVMAVKIAGQSIVLSVLPEDPDKDNVEEFLRRVRNQCVVARSFLRNAEVLDLQCILIGPRGSEGSDAWTPIAMAIDRDDRVARKFTWLRSSDPLLDDCGFKKLIKRTFLARPWAVDGAFTMAALDSLSRVAALADGGVSKVTAEEWINIGLQEDLDNDQIVQELVASWSRREK
ncbi:hypothetical protein [Stenotrophomonas sp. HMWF003]|uniref:ABC-three component system middle component 1 n=1 Tax=Stenotrophomonas sp. HMWF003 TaxID=2056840 RepID=UPI000FE23248|nr:hypothetical protein [Stenotrophomonas sp. HMWF003]